MEQGVYGGCLLCPLYPLLLLVIWIYLYRYSRLISQSAASQVFSRCGRSSIHFWSRFPWRSELSGVDCGWKRWENRTVPVVKMKNIRKGTREGEKAWKLEREKKGGCNSTVFMPATLWFSLKKAVRERDQGERVKKKVVEQSHAQNK